MSIDKRLGDVTFTDLFCGAGGSSLGAVAAGAQGRMAANHWPRAIETHNTNFPDMDHDCADVSQVDPRRYPRTDILIASPECTTHSPSRANKPEPTLWDPDPPGYDAFIRSRATMWDVVRFTEHHRYEIVVVENVLEIRRWAPFENWLGAMRSYGYEHRAVYLNSMVAPPTPQSRDRIYVVFWKRGNRAPDLRFDVSAWCPSCEANVQAIQTWKNPVKPWGKYRTQYLYRCPRCTAIAVPYAYPAATAIDWSLPAPRIGDRKKPLAEATMRRIRAGLERYGPAAIVAGAGNTYERPGYVRAWPLSSPLPTQQTTAQHALVVDIEHSNAAPAGQVRPVTQPLATQTTKESKALVIPLRTHGKATPVEESVFPTVVAGNAGHALLIRNFGIPGGDPSRFARPVDQPMGAITRSGNTALLMRNNSGGPEMSTPVSEPARTITSDGHQSLVTIPFLTDYHGDGRPWQARGVDQPMGTVETRDRRALVEPAIDVEDCGFRMLKPHEIGRAMAFPDDYVVLGNQEEKIAQYGNAVTPPVMGTAESDGILTRCIATLVEAGS